VAVGYLEVERSLDAGRGLDGIEVRCGGNELQPFCPQPQGVAAVPLLPTLVPLLPTLGLAQDGDEAGARGWRALEAFTEVGDRKGPGGRQREEQVSERDPGSSCKVLELLQRRARLSVQPPVHLEAPMQAFFVGTRHIQSPGKHRRSDVDTNGHDALLQVSPEIWCIAILLQPAGPNREDRAMRFSQLSTAAPTVRESCQTGASRALPNPLVTGRRA